MQDLRDQLPDFEMPFGKFEGRQIRDVPLEYLYWLWLRWHWKSDGPLGNYLRHNLEIFKQLTPWEIW